jgi:hypothetical protein
MVEHIPIGWNQPIGTCPLYYDDTRFPARRPCT